MRHARPKGMGSEGQSWNGVAASDGGGEGKPTPAAVVAPAQVEVPTSAAAVDISLPLPEMTPHIMVLCKDLVKGWSSLDSSCFSIETVSDSITNLCVKPDVVSYNTIINGHCLAGKMDEAMELLDGMVSIDLKPNAVNCIYLMAIVKMVGQRGCISSFQRVLSKGVKRGVITYDIILHGLFQTGRTAAARELYLKMIKSGTLLEIRTYDTILAGLCQNNRVDEALRMFQNLCSVYFQHEIRTFSIIIGALLKSWQKG